MSPVACLACSKRATVELCTVLMEPAACALKIDHTTRHSLVHWPETRLTWHRHTHKSVANLAVNCKSDSNQADLLPGKLPQLHERRPQVL